MYRKKLNLRKNTNDKITNQFNALCSGTTSKLIHYKKKELTLDVHEPQTEVKKLKSIEIRFNVFRNFKLKKDKYPRKKCSKRF